MTSHDLLARIAYNSGNFDQALAEGALATKVQPANSELFEVPIRAAIQLHVWSQGEEIAREGMQAHETAHLHVLLALLYAARGSRPEALAELDRALLIAPGDAEATQLRRQLTGG